MQIALVGFARGGVTRLTEYCLRRSWRVVYNAAPDTASAVIVGADGHDLLNKVRLVRAHGYCGQLVGVGRLDQEQRAVWDELALVERRTLHRPDGGEPLWVRIPGRQTLVVADPLKVDPEMVALALQVSLEDGQLLEVTRGEYQQLRKAKTTLELAIDKFSAAIRQSAAVHEGE